MTIELVKYEKKYAKEVANMWNESADAWGGKGSLDTEESIIQKEENSAFLDLTLAKLNSEIIGYCKLSLDHHDEGALYIDLLNVMPDFHGKSVGKKLLLDSLEKTIQRGWRRLDLFTWPGNTKAIPLYKKCGFFWEKRDETTHLINLIPDVLACDLVNDYFKTADWYKDSVRKIDVSPDSRIVNGFDLWNYEWEKDGKMLNMEYSRRGRGLRKIENDDFVIEVDIDNMKLVFGDSYKVKYLFTNKTNTPLNIRINGFDDKNIKFDFNVEFQLDKTKEIEGSFYVDKIQKKQKEKHTHPVVKSVIEVNGKAATFMTGIEPAFPMSYTFNTEHKLQKFGIETPCYIDIENECGSDATFEFRIENTDVLFLKDNAFKVFLKKDEKVSIKTAFTLKEAILITDKIKIKTIREGKETFEFERKLKILLQGNHGKLSGEGDDLAIIANGEYLLEFVKEQNGLEFTHVKTNESLGVFPPKLGKPFSQEFEKKQASSVKFSQENDWIQMSIAYESEDFKGITFNRKFKLHSNGLLKRWFEFKNEGQDSKDISFSDGTYIDAEAIITAYDKQIVSLENETSNDLGYIESSKLDENWICSNGDGFKCGLIWPKTYDIKILGYYLAVEHDIQSLSAGDSYVTEPIIIGANTFVDWHEVRENALGKTLERESLVLASDVEVNGGNPFVEDEFEVIYKEHKSTNGLGQVAIELEDHSYAANAQEAVKVKMSSGQGVLSLENKVDADHLRRHKMVFKKSSTVVDNNTYSKEGLEVYKIDNGVFTFECAPEFSPSISSLNYNGKEWLSSAFPKPISLSWWKAWVGGINTRPLDIILPTMAEEKRSCQYVTKVDNFGNVWSGLEITTSIIKHEKKKGISWQQYYLTLAGVPVMAYFSAYKNESNVFNFDKKIYSETFFDMPETAGEAYFKFNDENGREQKVLSGSHDRDVSGYALFEYHQCSTDAFITMYNGDRDVKKGFFVGTGIIAAWNRQAFSTEKDIVKSTKPAFMIMGKSPLQEDWLRDFNKIRF